MKFCFLIVVVLAYFVATVCCNDVDMKSIYKNIASAGEFDVSKLDSLKLTEQQIDYAIEKAIQDVTVQDLDFLTNQLLYSTQRPSDDSTQLQIILKFAGFKKKYDELKLNSGSEDQKKLDGYSAEAIIGNPNKNDVEAATEFISVVAADYTGVVSSAFRGAALGATTTLGYETTSDALYSPQYLASVDESAASILQATIDNLQKSLLDTSETSFNQNLQNSNSKILEEAEFVGFDVECLSNCGGSSKKKSEGLSDGAIAGIVIGSVAFAGGVGTAIYFATQSKGALEGAQEANSRL